MRFKTARNILKEQIELGALPGACLEVGDRNGTIERYVLGSRTLVPEETPLREDTVFDMASCTKMMATAPVAFHLIEQGKLCLRDRMDRFFTGLRPDAAAITIWNLLTHTSGIRPVTSIVGSARENVGRDILDMPLAFPTGTAVGYACLGYILLGRILEEVGDMSLPDMARKWVYEPLGMEHTGFCPRDTSNIAPTDIDRATGETSLGVVNDYNARALGGEVGNAGLFSNLQDTCRFARMLLRGGELDGQRVISPAMLDLARKDHTRDIPPFGEYTADRGLGMYIACAPGNSPAELLSGEAFGHTGHTGPTVLVDPVYGIYIVLMTSRLHTRQPRPGDEIWRIRRLVTNAIAAEL